MKFHPTAEIFPLMSDAELDALAEDIKTHGQQEVICLHQDGSILDGRNRWLACERAGVEPLTKKWHGIGSTLAFVISENLHRRHLSESQRAMVAARVAGLKKGQRQDRSIDPSTTQPEAAKLFNVSEPSIKRARTVQEHGAPKLVAAVRQGTVTVSDAAALAKHPKAEQAEALRAVVSGEVGTLKQATREQNRQVRMDDLIEKAKPLGGSLGRYPVIYVDPPWQYEHVVTESRAIENQYPTMNLDEICNLSVGDIATDDAILFLWATSPLLVQALQVIDAWGFGYRTCMVWAKDKIGMGYFVRQQHELLLIAKRGSPPMPAPANRPSSVVVAPRGKHSEKPERFYEIIEAMYPELPKVELFQRRARVSWVGWGNEA